MTTLSLTIHDQCVVITGENLAVEVRASNSLGMTSEGMDPSADSANTEQVDVDRSTERASSAVEVGAPNSPDGATRRLDGFGSVQDGRKMSTNGQPSRGLSTRDAERPAQGGVTGGESAASNSPGSAARGQAALSGECPEAPPMDGARKGPSGTAAILDTRSATPGADDGQRGIPSSEAGGAKMDERCRAHPDRAGVAKPEFTYVNSEQAVTNSPSAAPAETGEAPSPDPASPVTPINPNCAHPDTCKWARSMASCSACANAAAKARAA